MALWPKRECAPAPLRGIVRDELRSNRVGIKREFMPCALFLSAGFGRRTRRMKLIVLMILGFDNQRASPATYKIK